MADTIRKVKVVDDVIATESEVQYGVLVGDKTSQHNILKLFQQPLTVWFLILSGFMNGGSVT